MSNQLEPVDNNAIIAHELTFDFLMVLRGRAISQHTHRAYTRWVDRFLSEVTDMKPTTGKERTARMRALPGVVGLFGFRRTWQARLKSSSGGHLNPRFAFVRSWLDGRFGSGGHDQCDLAARRIGATAWTLAVDG